MENEYCHLIEKTEVYDGDYPCVELKYVTSCCNYEFDKYALNEVHFCPICGKEINLSLTEYIPNTKCKNCADSTDGTQAGCKYYQNHKSCFYEDMDKVRENQEREEYERLKKKFG